jgi:regulatory protein
VEGIVSAELIAEFKLALGLKVDAGEAQALTAAAHRLQVFDQGVALLAVKARSARELTRALARRGATGEECSAAVARLIELRLVDDASYARHLARAKLAAGGMSKRRIQQELARKGVAPAVASEALGEAIEDVGLDEFEAALAVAQKRMRVLGREDAAIARRRLYAFLARRGYESSVVSRVVARVLRGGEVQPVEGE